MIWSISSDFIPLFDYRILVTVTFGDNLPSDLTDRTVLTKFTTYAIGL